MRAAWYERTGPAAEVLTVGELPVPEPGPGEVLVRIAASGINPADVKRRAGWLLGPTPQRWISKADAAAESEAASRVKRQSRPPKALKR